MVFVNFDNKKSAARSFAVEEFLMKSKQFEDEYFLFWNTVPTLMIGRFQNTVEEINLQFAEENNMEITRRNSGGGTIYTDENCWQFSFITHKEDNHVKDFRNFTKPVLQALENLGIKAEFSGRNDLMFQGKKFSGNAQFSYKNRFLHHGSILFDANINDLVKSISLNDDKIISKGIKSIKERVVNLKNSLKNPNLSTYDFRDEMLKFLKKNMPTIELSDSDWAEILKIENEKFKTWDWNFGKSPEFTIKKAKRFEGGKIEVLLNVKQGNISDCKFLGDFFFNGNIEEFEKKIIGLRYEKQEILKFLSKFEKEELFYNISKDEFMEVFL